MTRWMVRRDGDMDSYADDEDQARIELQEAKEDAQDNIANGCFDEDGTEYATLYRFDPVPRSALRDGAEVLPGDLFLRVKVAWVELRELGQAGDGSEAGRKAEAAGLDFWAEAVIIKADPSPPETAPDPAAGSVG